MRPGATSEVQARVIPKNLTDLLDELGIGAMQHKVTPHHSECGRTLRDHFVASYLLAEDWGNSKDVVGTRERERETHTEQQARAQKETKQCIVLHTCVMYHAAMQFARAASIPVALAWILNMHIQMKS